MSYQEIAKRNNKIRRELLNGYINYDKLAKKYSTSRYVILNLRSKLGEFTPKSTPEKMEDIEFWNPEIELGDFRIEIDNEGVKHIYQSKMN